MSILGAAGIIAGGSLLSGIFGSRSSSSASKAQLQATRETNEQNYKIWQEQKQHNLDMYNLQNQDSVDFWNMQNDYNSPTAQIARLRAAGLNPYLNMGNNPSGSASSAPEVGNINSSQPPTMQTPDASAFQLQAQGNPWYGLFQGLAQGAMNFGNTWSSMTNAQTNKDVGNSQIGLNNANTRMVLLNKEWAPRLWQEDINSKKALASLHKSEAKFNEKTINIRTDLLNASLIGMQLSNEQQRILNYYLPEEKQLSIGLLNAELSLKVAQGKLTERQAENLLYERMKMQAEIKEIKARTENIEQDTMNKTQQYWNLGIQNDILGLDYQDKLLKTGLNTRDELRRLASQMLRTGVSVLVAQQHDADFNYNLGRGTDWILGPVERLGGAVVPGKSTSPRVPYAPNYSPNLF